MRLLRVDIEEFRSIKKQWLPADGLVVLLGPNSAGKTSVLEAVENLIAQAGTLRTDPGDPEDLFVMGSVTFDLPGADVAGSEDAEIYRSLLCGQYSKADEFGSTDDPWAWLADGLTGQLKQAELGQARSLLAETLVSAGSTGTPVDRELLARCIFDPSSIYFTADTLDIDLAVHGPSMPPAAVDAARRIAAEDGNDALWKVASDLASNAVAHIGRVAGGAGHGKSFAAAFPPVVLLDGDPESLSAELQRAVPVIHDRLWHAEPEKVTHGPGSLVAWTVDGFEIHEGGLKDRYFPDPWLEGRSEAGEPILSGIFDPYDTGDWYRVRHSILAAAKLIEAEANRVAPGFVTDQGTIGIEILPVSVWGSRQDRVRATFTEFGEGTRDLRVVGAGTARWVAAAVRLACRRLEKGRQLVTDEANDPVDDKAERRRIIRKARDAPFAQKAVRLEPFDAPAFYIADEPEAHLHPAALQSVQQWLIQLAESAATVLVATHSTVLLDSTSELINRVLVLRNEEGTQLRRMTGDLGHELARVSDELGLTRGELLLLTRLALFVEGPHDQIVLNEWFGDDLRAAGIHVYPVHGVDHMAGLANSEVVAALGIRIATLSDDTSITRVAAGKPPTRGDIAVGRLLAEAAKARIQVHTVGLEQPDILYYLDEGVCRQVASGFPGWHAAAAERIGTETHVPWKRWIQSKYGLPLSREGIRDLARASALQHKIPAEISRKIRELIAYAVSKNSEDE